MRFLSVLFAAFILTTCSMSPIAHSQSKATRQTHAATPKPRKASKESVIEFLITSAATDFYTNGPHPVSFRDLHIGHLITPNGQKQHMLCGQFLRAQKGGKAKWTLFATIKTSGYEQYVGAQAAIFCQDSSVIWDKTKNLSSLLQSRLDSLRQGTGR